MLDKNNLLALMKTVAKADVSAPTSYSFNGESFSYEALNETLRRELKEYAGDYASYRENKNLIFSLIEETLDEILPKKVTKQYEAFEHQSERQRFHRKDQRPSMRRCYYSKSSAGKSLQLL